MRGHRLKPSPALVVASIAVLMALTGAAIAGHHGITRSTVRSISKKQANARITARAPRLAVARARSANPAAFAQVAEDGTVNAANSKGLTQANLINTNGTVGFYCFGNLPFVPRGANANIDWNDGPDYIAMIGIGGNATGECPAGTQLFVDTRKLNGTGSTPSGFFLTIYR